MTTACGQRLTQQELHRAYQQALASTESRARSDWSSNPTALVAAIGRLQDAAAILAGERGTQITAQQADTLWWD